MESDLMAELLKAALEALKIDRPVLAYRLVGGRLELWLLGAAEAVYFDAQEEQPQSPRSAARKGQRRSGGEG